MPLFLPPGRRRLTTFAAIWLLGVAGATLADECAVMARSSPDTPEAWSRLYERLAVLEQHCAKKDADFLALLGAAQLNTGRLNAALATLEQAILQMPRHGGAQVDYALALQRSGQPFAALALNRQLLARDDLPEGLATLLTERSRRWKTTLGEWQHRLSTRVGYDNNLNASPDLRYVTLTLPNLSISLPLTNSTQPRPGATQTLSWQSHYTRDQENGQREWQLGASQRTAEGDFDSLQLSARLSREWSLDAGSLTLAGQAEFLRYAGNSLFRSGGTELSWRPGRDDDHTCAMSYMLEATYQDFLIDSNLNGVELRAGPKLSCPLGNIYWQVEASYITNLATDEERMGSDRTGWEARLGAARRLGKGVAGLSLETLHLTDRQGYNPLLDHGNRRRIARYRARLQYQYPLSDTVSLSASTQYRYQRSNLALFEFDSTQYELGLNWRW